MSNIKHMLEQRQRRKQMDINERLSANDRIINSLLGDEDALNNALKDARWLAAIGWAAFAYLAYWQLTAPVMIVAGMECRL